VFIERTFQHRSGRVIALGRLVLAAVFLFAVWLDPSQPSRAPAIAYAILAAYVLLAAAILALTWADWWLDHRLAKYAHAADIVVFTVMVSLIEGYTSPFFTFFVFLFLSATIRWGWRETALTAILVIVLFLAAGVAALQLGDAEFDLRRLLIRSAYLVVLSLILIWFGINQEEARSGRTRPLAPEEEGERSVPLVRHLLAHAAERTGASRVLLAWWDKEEPWVNVSLLEGDGLHTRRFGPAELGQAIDPALADRPFLFGPGARLLRRARTPAVPEPVGPELAKLYDLHEGLAIPIETEDHQGVIFAQGVPGLCADDLDTAERIGADVSAALQRDSLLRMSEDAAATRTRLSLARDLHDSVAQLLAGTSFRLEAMRQAARTGRDISGDISALQAELAQEQADLRHLIGKLRGEGDTSGRIDPRAALATLAERLGRQWGVTCSIASSSPSLQIPARMEHDLHQLIREGVANAVRHGKAERVELLFGGQGRQIELQIVDNGSGFPDGAGETIEGPRSLSERVRALGGQLRVDSGAAGSRIWITLPMESRG
jgi:signal transduction histidine kinase